MERRIIVDEIIILINQHFGSFKFKLNENTRIEEDLDITGDEAVRFIQLLSDQYDLALSLIHI